MSVIYLTRPHYWSPGQGGGQQFSLTVFTGFIVFFMVPVWDILPPFSYTTVALCVVVVGRRFPPGRPIGADIPVKLTFHHHHHHRHHRHHHRHHHFDMTLDMSLTVALSSDKPNPISASFLGDIGPITVAFMEVLFNQLEYPVF